jgi:hypothetical protein
MIPNRSVPIETIFSIDYKIHLQALTFRSARGFFYFSGAG